MHITMSDIIPVFLGADLNCYNFARAFHEAYGVESYAYGRYPMAPTKYSKIIHFTTVPDMDNEDTMLRILHEFAAQHKGKRLYLFGCTDDYAAMIIRRKAELTEYIAPGPAADLYGSIQKKAEFYEVCEKFGIPYPDSKILTAPVDAAELTEDKLGFAYPIIVKPSSSVDYWKHPFDTMKKVYTAATPAEVRALIRTGQLTAPTTGYCDGYAQGNLVVLPKALAWDFLLFCQRNPKACPLLEVTDAGQRSFSQFAPDSDIARDIPRYRIYRNGELAEETTDVTHYFEERNDLVSFLIGCSFSFESALLEADIPVRQIEEGVNVPMYNTNIPCTPAGVFSGNMVVSMRPIPYAQVPAAVAITAGMPRVHGAPVQIGTPEAIGITDLAHPDYGDAVTIRPGETPVFWPCGVTPQAVVMHSKPAFCITHAPGHMFITDVKNTALKF